MSDSEVGTARMSVTRRPHKKTRSGCGTCKRRRIKCDETKPSCVNCTKHSLTCIYAPQPAKISSQPPTSNSGLTPAAIVSPGLIGPSTPANTGSPFGNGSVCAPEYVPALTTYGLALDQLELLQQYLNYTSITTAIGSADRDYMRVTVISVGLAYPFILHECLALGALHLARYKVDRTEHYQHLAKYHNDAALRLATPTLRDITSDNCHATFIFTTLAFCYTLGKGPQEGDYMIFSDHGAAEAFPLLRGTRAVIESFNSMLKSGILAPVFRKARDDLTGSGPVPPELQEVLHFLRSAFASAEVDKLEMYEQTLDMLSEILKRCFAPDGTKRKPATNVAFTWLYQLPMEYVLAVQRKEPPALAILGHFCVLLNDISVVWWMEGWAKHIFGAVYRYIGPNYRSWILWPMEQIGWLPPFSDDFSSGNGMMH